MMKPARSPGQEETSLDLREVLRASRRHPWLSIGVPVALLASTGFFLWWTAPVYEAATTIRVDQDRSGVAIIEALRTLSSGSKITTEMEELRSRSLAEEIVDSLALDLEILRPRKVSRAALFDRVVTDPLPTGARYTFNRIADGVFRVAGPDGVAREVRVGEVVSLTGLSLVLAPTATEHDRIVIRRAAFGTAVRTTQDRLDVSRPNREADIVQVRYENTDRLLARAVPDLMARRFIARRNSVRTREARSTADFLDEQIGALHAQLTVTEDELRAFRERYGVISIEAQGEAQVTRLADMQANRELLDVDRQALASVIADLPEQSTDPLAPSPYRALLGFPTLLRNQAAGELLSALNEAEAQRSSLLDHRTLEDGEVIQITLRIRQIETQLRDIALTYLKGVTETVRSLDGTLAAFSSQLQQIPEHELHLARLRRTTAVTEELYTSLQLRLKEAEIMAAMDDPTVRVVDPAVVPRRPIRPQVPLSLALALAGGLVLGIGSAAAREQMDGTVRTRDDLQQAGRVPVLASIPGIHAVTPRSNRLPLPWLSRANGSGNGRRAPKVLDAAAMPVVAEAYRSLRTNITFAQPDRAPRSIVITSPAPGDGKSTTAVNLASTMAQQGHSCLLIDGDMRRGRLHETFGGAREPGLSNVLLGQLSLAEAVRSASAQAPALLTTGTLPPNPAELLGSDRMKKMMASALELYDIVILDAPPLNMVTDAAVVSRHADGVLVVARAGVTERSALSYTFEQLEAVRAPVLGSILNDADPQRERHYGAYMADYYGAPK
ncbi:polysaccharide biosynthesis tyrosine autokinase [soil metagenome]